MFPPEPEEPDESENTKDDIRGPHRDNGRNVARVPQVFPTDQAYVVNPEDPETHGDDHPDAATREPKRQREADQARETLMRTQEAERAKESVAG